MCQHGCTEFKKMDAHWGRCGLSRGRPKGNSLWSLSPAGSGLVERTVPARTRFVWRKPPSSGGMENRAGVRECGARPSKWGLAGGELRRSAGLGAAHRAGAAAYWTVGKRRRGRAEKSGLGSGWKERARKVPRRPAPSLDTSESSVSSTSTRVAPRTLRRARGAPAPNNINTLPYTHTHTLKKRDTGLFLLPAGASLGSSGLPSSAGAGFSSSACVVGKSHEMNKPIPDMEGCFREVVSQQGGELKVLSKSPEAVNARDGRNGGNAAST
ncbi:hypothetical protein DFH09DRAFT_1105319 [Mycena vulgaris]|nr:hypothetical protein DFH09DRAFT_1105319 [Mycena vulgaris]